MEPSSPEFFSQRIILLSLLSVGLVCVVAVVVALTRQVVWVEQSSSSTAQEERRRVLSPFNTQLMTMCVSLVGTYVCFMSQIAFSHNPWVMTALLDFLTGTFEISYVWYSWTRASTIIGRVHPRTAKAVDSFVRFAPLFLYAQVVPAVFDALCSLFEDWTPLIQTGTLVEQTLSSFASVCVFVFDVALLSGFSKHIRQMYRDMEEVGVPKTDHFIIIVHHGVVSSALWIAVIFIYAATMFLPQHSFEYDVVTVLIYFLSTANVFVLFRMKVSVHQNSVRESSSMMSAAYTGHSKKQTFNSVDNN
ncbi:hypothetical protein BJ741DRAFT_671582 [Chytriomyces cf. hyalinus JEL632]|nr:hypothetical protein BJ741DRAFT_671582 [Chytriomyces cf. hyalinus JEL632]